METSESKAVLRGASPNAGLRPARTWLVLGLLTVALTLSFVDRYLLAMLMAPIKAELALSDLQLGVLTGFAFSAFYGIFALPLGLIADRGHARSVVAGALFCWSIATGACGVAQNFAQLAFARFAVGAGEAGCGPATQLIVANIFADQRRSTALAIVGASGCMGLTIAFAFAGIMEPRLGWRMTFICAAAPGLLLGCLVHALIPASVEAVGTEERWTRRSALASFKALRSNRLFAHAPFIFAACSVLQLVQLQWLPAFLGRSFDAPRGEVGIQLAMCLGPAMLFGTLAGGFLADRMQARSELWPMRIVGLSTLCALVPAWLLYTTHDVRTAIPMATVAAFFVGVPNGPLFAFVQKVVAPDQRASAAAITLLGTAFLGLGGGAIIVGLLSDLLQPRFGVESLRWALLTTCMLATAWVLLHVLLITKRLKISTLSTRGGEHA